MISPVNLKNPFKNLNTLSIIKIYWLILMPKVEHNFIITKVNLKLLKYQHLFFLNNKESLFDNKLIINYLTVFSESVVLNYKVFKQRFVKNYRLC